jgi:hypothetical protein
MRRFCLLVVAIMLACASSIALGQSNGTKAKSEKKPPTDLLTKGSKWTGKGKDGITTTYEVISRDKTEAVLERPSIDNVGAITVTLSINGGKVALKRVGYRGDNKRTIRTLDGKAFFNGEKLLITFTALSNGTARWTESHKLVLEE